MNSDREDLKLRFYTGKFEQAIIDCILILQIMIGFSVCIMVYVIIGSYLSVRGSGQIYPIVIYPIGALVVIYALSYLYE